VIYINDLSTVSLHPNDKSDMLGMIEKKGLIVYLQTHLFKTFLIKSLCHKQNNYTEVMKQFSGLKDKMMKARIITFKLLRRD
jgi:hypothetical protein